MGCPAAASRALRWALVRSAEAAGVSLEIHRAEAKAWASNTFDGARHLVLLGASTSKALQGWLESLPGTDVLMGGHLVADLQVPGILSGDGCTTAMLEILTVEDR